MYCSSNLIRSIETADLCDPVSPFAIIRSWSCSGCPDELRLANDRFSNRVSPKFATRSLLLRGLDDPEFLEIEQWTNSPARDLGWAMTLASGEDRIWDSGVALNWRFPVDHYRTFSPTVAPPTVAPPATCLITVRQPMLVASGATARAWIDAVFNALESPLGTPQGLSAAAFYVSRDGEVALILAEWADDADALRNAPASVAACQTGGLIDSDAWRAVRNFPGIAAEQVVRHYSILTESL